MSGPRRGRPPGPRIRSIKPEMPQDERIAKLSIPAELLFVRLISMADDEGRFRAAVNGIIGFAFPDRDDVTAVKVRRWLREIEAQEMILTYEHDGARYGVVRNFGRHQAVSKPTPSRLPEPPDPTIVEANVPEALRDEDNSSGTNTGATTGVLQERDTDHSDLSRTPAHAGACAGFPDPRSSSSSTTKEGNQQRGARGKVDQLIPPRELGADHPEIADRLDPVLAILTAVQAERGGNTPTIRGVGLALVAYPRRDHVGVARKLQHWAIAGRGQRKTVKDWVATYRTFLDGEPDADPGRPAAGDGPTGPTGGAPSVDQLIDRVQQRSRQQDGVIEGRAAA